MNYLKLHIIFYCLCFIHTYAVLGQPITPHNTDRTMTENKKIELCSNDIIQDSLFQFLDNTKVQYITCQSEDSASEASHQSKISSDEIAYTGKYISLVSQCFNLPWRIFLAKLRSESGLLNSVQGQNKDTGIGQLTSSGILDVQKNWKTIWSSIYQSEDANCKELSSLINADGVDNFFIFEPSNKCKVAFGMKGLLRNIVFSASIYQLNKKYVSQSYLNKNIPALLEAAGYKNAPHDKIKDLLILLSYNNGSSSTVKDLSEFLKSRIDFQNRKMKEFNPEQLNFEKVKKSLALVSKNDFQFSKGMERYLQILSSLKSKETPNDFVPLRNISVSTLGFPEWLEIWQTNGGPGYLTGIYQSSLHINDKISPLCSDLDYFDLK